MLKCFTHEYALSSLQYYIDTMNQNSLRNNKSFFYQCGDISTIHIRYLELLIVLDFMIKKQLHTHI